MPTLLTTPQHDGAEGHSATRRNRTGKVKAGLQSPAPSVAGMTAGAADESMPMAEADARNAKPMEPWRKRVVAEKNRLMRRKYAEAVRLYAETDMLMKDIALRCGLSRGALGQHLRRHHRELLLRRHGIETEGRNAEAVKIMQAGRQTEAAHAKYKLAVEACDSMNYMDLNVSQIARMFHVTPTGLANFLRTHYPDIIPNREHMRQRLGLADNTERGARRASTEQYAKALELYRTTNMTMPEIAAMCNVSEGGLSQHLRFYHREILRLKDQQRRKAQTMKNKPKGAMLGNGHKNCPSPSTVMKYAAALSLYKSTTMTMKDIVAKTNVSAEGFRFYLHKWHLPLVLERSGVSVDMRDAGTRDLRRARTKMKTVAAKYALAIASLKANPRPMAAVAREFGHHPEAFRQYLHKHEPELVLKSQGGI